MSYTLYPVDVCDKTFRNKYIKHSYVYSIYKCNSDILVPLDIKYIHNREPN